MISPAAPRLLPNILLLRKFRIYNNLVLSFVIAVLRDEAEDCSNLVRKALAILTAFAIATFFNVLIFAFAYFVFVSIELTTLRVDVATFLAACFAATETLDITFFTAPCTFVASAFFFAAAFSLRMQMRSIRDTFFEYLTTGFLLRLITIIRYRCYITYICLNLLPFVCCCICQHNWGSQLS